MNTKLLLILSALFMAIIGLVCIFAPVETIVYFKLEPSKFLLIVLQLMGGLYFGFAFINWMSRFMTLGGIYGKPIVMGNVLHFLVGSMVLLKSGLLFQNLSIAILIVFYLLFAILFLNLFFEIPKT